MLRRDGQIARVPWNDDAPRTTRRGPSMIDERDVHEMLHRRANAVPTPAVDAPKATRRARRRLFVNGAVALLAVVAIALVGLARVDEIRGAPVPADQPTPSVPASVAPEGLFTDRFDSPLNGLSIGYPAGWRTRAATQPWAHDTLAFDAPDVDVIFDPTSGDGLYIAVGSEPLGTKSPKDWVYDTMSANDHWSDQICQRGGGGGAGDPFQGNFAWFEECH